MTFLDPIWLWAALAALALALLAAPLSARAALARLRAFADPSGNPALAADVAGRARRRWRLRGAALALLAVAMAGPLYGERQIAVRPTGADVVIAIDTSLSMAATDLKPSRLARARHLAEALMERLSGYRVGLVVFSGAAFPAVPLTDDHGAVRLYLDALAPNMVPRPGSSLQAALEEAARMFGDDNGAGRAVIVLSDGEATVGSSGKGRRVAAGANMAVFAIGVGGNEGVPIPVTDAKGRFAGYKRDASGQLVTTRLEADALREIAEADGAYYESTLDGAEIDAIATRIAALASGERETAARARPENRYQWPLALALALMIADLAWPAARRREVAA